MRSPRPPPPAASTQAVLRVLRAAPAAVAASPFACDVRTLVAVAAPFFLTPSSASSATPGGGSAGGATSQSADASSRLLAASQNRPRELFSHAGVGKMRERLDTAAFQWLSALPSARRTEAYETMSATVAAAFGALRKTRLKVALRLNVKFSAPRSSTAKARSFTEEKNQTALEPLQLTVCCDPQWHD